MYTALLWLCITLAILVFGVMLYSVGAYRVPRDAAPVRHRNNVFIELLWAAVPIAIMVIAALPILRTMALPSAPIPVAVALQE
jgi:cytochrome c oxidase subunit II